MRLKFCGVEEIWIEEDDNGQHIQEVNPKREIPRYIEIIKETERFKEFNQAHEVTVKSLEEELNQALVNNKEIDSKRLLQDVDHILEGIQNGVHVVEMLQCIRVYDDSTYVHCVNVALLCNVMGRWLKLPEEEIEVLTLSGLLHDIGKLMIPPAIIKKAGKLTELEYRTIRNHPSSGYSVIENKELDERIKRAVLQHHEKCDGTGYPNQLVGSEIDDFAKIVTITDIYEAMTANRVYREGLCPFDVVELFEQEGLSKYDPVYMMIFIKRIAESYINKPVLLSNGQEGQIIMLNQSSLSRPVVQVKGNYIDLSKTIGINIQRIL